MNEYLDDLDYQLVHHQLLKVLIIYVLLFHVVYHEVHVEEQEQLELDLWKNKIKKKRGFFSKKFNYETHQLVEQQRQELMLRNYEHEIKVHD
jgi:hypothetical protein